MIVRSNHRLMGGGVCLALMLGGALLWRAQKPPPRETASLLKSPQNEPSEAPATAPRPESTEAPLLFVSQQAPPVEPLNLREDARLTRTDIESSGDAPAHWLDELKALFAAWQQNHPLPAGVRLQSWACYHDGCFAHLTVSESSAFGRLNVAVGGDDPFKGWAERSTLVGPERGEHGLEALWLVVPEQDRGAPSTR